ncbi:MAG: DEAD/DEAH box helicase [Bacteroidales bacterium]|nr:DEAD/DEAH box helicase [Bacteroidales bacterium]
MSNVELFDFQRKILEDTSDKNHVAYYLDMGLGKTFVGSEKMYSLGANINLVVCQKSKIDDWIEHFETHYNMNVLDLTKPAQFDAFKLYSLPTKVGIINYELIFRRPDLRELRGFTLMLDESSMIQNESAKRTKFILDKLHPENVVLLSGTPTGGKYEKLWSQLRLLGWRISKTQFWEDYIRYYIDDSVGFPMKIPIGYKNVDQLKSKLREYGAVFLKSDEILDLPEQIFQTIHIDTTPAYKRFKDKRIVKIDDHELVGDTTFNYLLYARQLCGQYNQNKLDAFRSLLQSCDDRLIVFYNFKDELAELMRICKDEHRPVSTVNGDGRDLSAYESQEDSVTLIQYQAGAMGLNLQKASRIVYFTPPLSSELFEQSKKRTHRIGQKSTCFYYFLTCRRSVEQRIYSNLGEYRDYTDKLFEDGC